MFKFSLLLLLFFIPETVNAEDILEEEEEEENLQLVLEINHLPILTNETFIIYLFDICIKIYSEINQFQTYTNCSKIINLDKYNIFSIFFFFCTLWLVYSYHICLPRALHNYMTMTCQKKKKLKKIAVQVLVYTYLYSKRTNCHLV